MMRGMKRASRSRTSSPADHALGPAMNAVVARARDLLHSLEIVLDITLAGVLVIAIALIGSDTVGLIAEGIHEGGIDSALLILDRVLLVFIIAELLYTLRLSLARTQLLVAYEEYKTNHFAVCKGQCAIIVRKHLTKRSCC